MDFDPALQIPLQQALNASVSPVHHILTGSFRSVSLFLLVFSPLKLTLNLVQTIPAFGPHQYIGLGPHTQGGDVRYAYTTSWALPPQLQSWAIEQQSEGLQVRFVDSVDISAPSFMTCQSIFIFSSGNILLCYRPSAVLARLLGWRTLRPSPRPGFPWIRAPCSGDLLCTQVRVGSSRQDA
jgi:hypothetical protein